MLAFSLNNDYNNITFDNVNISPITDEGKEYLSNFFVAVINRKNRTTNSDAYGKRSHDNNNINKLKNEVSLATTEELEKCKEKTGISNAIPEAVLGYIDGNIERVIEDDAIRNVLENLNEMQDYLEIEAGVNLLMILRRAVKGNTRAINKLRELKTEFSMDTMIRELLSTPNWYELYEYKYHPSI